MKSKLLQGFYLGDLLIEPLRGRVTGRAGSQHLTPKSVEVLLCLALEPGELVTREHLLDEVWGVGHGSQEALSHAIGEIRHVLDDHPDNPSFVQTLPKRGYRLLVEPELANETTSTVVLGTANGARLADIGFLENLKQRGVLETAIAYLIVGKSGKLPDSVGGGSTAFDWLDIEKSANEAGEKAILILCVPPEVDVGTEYKFDVEIEELGKLDPRVEVVN